MNKNIQLVQELFWSQVHVACATRCWPWRGAKDSRGYGQMKLDGKTIKSPRIAFMLRTGAWPNNWALHKCDNPICCNPDHIYDGTPKNNAEDRERRGRRRIVRGEDDGRAILTELKVLAIRAEYKTTPISQSKLAKKYSISQTNINHIVTGKSWRHIL